jgi:phage tail-like protein
VADARARRVVVILPDDGSVRAILGDPGMREPVDVAVSPSGCVYVADRGGNDPDGNPLAGRIFMFTAGLQSAGSFVPRNGEGLPVNPRPIAVMVEADGGVMVADGNHPRLLRFTECSDPLADAQLTSLVRDPSVASVSRDALGKAYGKLLPRFFAGVCAPPRPPHDGGERIAAVHRAIRLLFLALGRSFESAGVFVSGALDSGIPGTTWHRLKLEADIPEGTQITIETTTADDPAGFDPATAVWDGPLIPFTLERGANSGPVLDHLIQSKPGRYLWTRVTLSSDGTATPSLRALQVFYPRVSYLDLLPRVYRRDPESALFLEHFLALFELVFTGIENRYEEFSRQLNPDAAPLEVINWLGSLIDLAFDPSWPLERRRALVAAAMELYRKRGTIEGLKRYIEIYTGIRPEIVESFLERPGRPSFLGRPGWILGCSAQLTTCQPDRTPDEALMQQFAHRFRIYVYLTDRCDADVTTAVVDQIVTANKPAHTVHSVCAVFPDAALGRQSLVGLDFVLGGREAPSARLGGCVTPGEAEIEAGTLGVDTILGERRPSYVRPLEFRL